MKFSLFLTAASLGLASLVNAQLDIDFGDTGVYPGPEVAGSDGWSISDATTGLSFLTDVGGANWGSLGGYYDVPVGPGEVSLSHAVGAPAKTSSLITKFFIESSRDSFGFRFGGGTSGLFEFQFVPNNSTPGLMDIFVGVGGGTPVASGSGLFDDTMYVLQVDFNEGGSGSLEMFATIGGSSSSFTLSGVLPGEANASWDTLEVLWDSQTGGDNFIALQGFSSVPEPGSAMASLLAGVMGVTVTMRRRRRA
jgi:hypothetical protein